MDSESRDDRELPVFLRKAVEYLESENAGRPADANRPGGTTPGTRGTSLAQSGELGAADCGRERGSAGAAYPSPAHRRWLILRMRMTPQAASRCTMVLEAHIRAAWYERQGPAQQVLKVGTMSDPIPGPGEVRIRIAASGARFPTAMARARSISSVRCVGGTYRAAGLVLRSAVIPSVGHGRGIHLRSHSAGSSPS
jgi:hypothetical protein